MLRELHIRNFSIIDNTTVEFGNGFNVMTGETGAGKSIIINALSLALGERAAGEFIRSGEKEAVVEAFFDISPETIHYSVRQFLQESGIDIDDGIILKRIITSQGRNRAYINSSMVSVQNLSDVSRNLIDVHGQYEHQSLLSAENQMYLIDAYGGLLEQRDKVSKIYDGLHSIKKQITALVHKDKESARQVDMLRFQINEIESANLIPSEEEELTEEVKILSNTVRLAELSNEAYESLYLSDSSCITALSKILDALIEISEIDARAADAVQSIKNAQPLLEETGYFLRDYREGLDFDPQRLGSVQERLELIKGLKRKYGSSIKEVLDFREKAVAELEGLQHSEEKLLSLKKELDELRAEFTGKAQQLSKKRKNTAKKIEKLVKKQLSELSMPDTEFAVRIIHEKGDDTTDGLQAAENGIDNIEFLISPNIGEDLRPLSKTASGGELSRIMLALKVILAKEDKMPVLVFDEIDAGIGGAAGETVGKKLSTLASTHQVICITHLPQIASYADSHLKIEKKTKMERTMVEVNRIEKEQRTEEVARMLSGRISDVSMKHARELLKPKSGS
jgi:DNA repair protein RecN (Recombination protein N)